MKIWPQTKQKIAFALLGLAALIVIIPVVLILAILVQRGLPEAAELFPDASGNSRRAVSNSHSISRPCLGSDRH